MRDNLFDKEFTILDAVKILLLVVTAFSTWNVIDLMTPDGSLAFVREFAALGVVEGAFLGFEMATAKAKSRRQTKFATIGFFCSLVVIGVFAGVSGLLEFGGPELLAQTMGEWLGITWLMKDVVMVSSLVVLVVWIVALAALYRLYSLNDPDKRAELDRIALDEEVTEESNKATRIALQKAQPTIASARARAHVKDKYTGEVGLAEMDNLLSRVDARLQENYGVASVPSRELAVDPERGFVPRVPPHQSMDDRIAELEEKNKGSLYDAFVQGLRTPSNVVVNKLVADGRVVVWKGSRGYLGKFADRDGNVWVSFWQTDLDLATRQPEQFRAMGSRPDQTIADEGNEIFREVQSSPLVSSDDDKT